MIFHLSWSFRAKIFTYGIIFSRIGPTKLYLRPKQGPFLAFMRINKGPL